MEEHNKLDSTMINNKEEPKKEIQIKKWFLVLVIPLLFLLLLQGMEEILKTQGIQYRSWLEITMAISFLFLLPFLLFTFLELLLEYWKKRMQRKWISILSGMGQILLIGILGFYIPVMGFLCLLTFESIFETERTIGNGYIEGTTLEFLGADDEINYQYYTPISFFAKKKYEDKITIVKMKMEQKYGEEFHVTRAAEDEMSETWMGCGYLAVPESFPEITVHVLGENYSYPFLEDYAVQRSAYQGMKYLSENSPGRAYQIIYDNSMMKEFYGWLHVNCMGLADAEQCAKDTAGIMDAILADSFMQDKMVCVYVDCYRDKDGGIYESDGENNDINQQMANVPFYLNNGKISAWDYQNVISEENREQEIYEALALAYNRLEKNAWNTNSNQVDADTDENADTDRNTDSDENIGADENAGIDKNAGIDGNTKTDTNMEDNREIESNMNTEQAHSDTIIATGTSDNSTPEGAYQTLYETLFQREGDAYQTTYNAKGNFYAILDVGAEEVDGQMQNYRRTIVYDRESKNGNCLLFVAYKEYTYFDGSPGNTAILNFYAVEKSTGKVVVGDKKAWADLGSKEYRDITGE